MLPTRHDLLLPHVADQLALLQDKVAPLDGKLAKRQTEVAVDGLPIEAWFDDSEIKPPASASIAQVYIARLKSNGKEVVIKVIRPDILPTIKTDLKLIYRLARWMPRLLLDDRRLRLTEVVCEYEKTLISELNLLREPANAIQPRRNFEDSSMLYIPEVYPDCRSERMMVMERIYGTPMSDVATLRKSDTNVKLLAERGMQVFFVQTSRNSLFHADMHLGNISVNYEHPENPKYIGIDCGIVGLPNKGDKCYLVESFIAFFNRDYRRTAELHVDSDRAPLDTDIEKFEFAIRTVCEPIFEKPLVEISFEYVLLNSFSTTRRLNMEVQPQLMLLQKTLLYVREVGHQLYPQFDLRKAAKPFLEPRIKDQVGIPVLVGAFGEKAPFRTGKMLELPELVYDSLRQSEYLQHSVDKVVRELQLNHVRQGQPRYFLGIDATSILSDVFLLVNRPEWRLMPG